MKTNFDFRIEIQFKMEQLYRDISKVLTRPNFDYNLLREIQEIFSEYGYVFPDWRDYMTKEHFDAWKQIVDMGVPIFECYHCAIESISYETGMEYEDFTFRKDLISEEIVKNEYDKWDKING